MQPRLQVFLDTSALFVAVWSQSGGARMLLRLGEAGVGKLLVSSQVLHEIEITIQRKAPDLLPQVAVLMERCDFVVVSQVDPRCLSACQRATGHPADGLILAQAWSAWADYFVTLDRQHFLENASLRRWRHFPSAPPAIAWHGYANS